MEVLLSTKVLHTSTFIIHFLGVMGGIERK